jgi:hypothetical protein
MRTLVVSRCDSRLDFTVGKSTPFAPTDLRTNDTTGSHGAVRISAPGSEIISRPVKVVLLRRLHLDRPIFGLVMGRAED